MKVKIDEKLLCIPPYISTTWEQVTFLQSEEDTESQLSTLVIHLTDGKEVRIQNLDMSLIDIAFSSHVKYLEKMGNIQNPSPKSIEEIKTMGNILQQLTGLSADQLANMPIRFGISGLEGMPGMEVLQHNQAQSNSPNMPQEVVEKICGMIKMMIQGDIASFPKPEPHCNCPHCQVARTIHGTEKAEEDISASEQTISDEDLKFREWDIARAGDQLYVVTNPLDSREHYSVYLGTPVGCTCGQPHCEHIKAVLYS